MGIQLSDGHRKTITDYLQVRNPKNIDLAISCQIYAEIKQIADKEEQEAENAEYGTSASRPPATCLLHQGGGHAGADNVH